LVFIFRSIKKIAEDAAINSMVDVIVFLLTINYLNDSVIYFN
jgi:hypothetical protein